MREIKFRAWDKKSKCFREIRQWVVNGKNYEYMLSDPTESALGNWVLRNKEEVDLCQFTGLKDKNGVEIYEGDVVLYDNDIFPALVVFNNGSFQTECPFTKDLGDLVKNKIQIIGNIHQNPDLLK